VQVAKRRKSGACQRQANAENTVDILTIQETQKTIPFLFIDFVMFIVFP